MKKKKQHSENSSLHTIPCLDIVFEQNNTHVSREYIRTLSFHESIKDFKTNYVFPNTPFDLSRVPEFQEILHFKTRDITQYSIQLRKLITLSNICVHVKNHFENDWTNAMYLVKSKSIRIFLEQIQRLEYTGPKTFSELLKEYYTYLSKNFQNIENDCTKLHTELKTLFDSYIYDSNISTLCISYLYS